MDRVEREYYMTLFKTRVKEEWFEWTVGYGHTKEVVSVCLLFCM